MLLRSTRKVNRLSLYIQREFWVPVIILGVALTVGGTILRAGKTAFDNIPKKDARMAEPEANIVKKSKRETKEEMVKEVKTVEKKLNERIIGMDIGSSLSKVCIRENGKVVFLENGDGQRFIPSAIHITAENPPNILFGHLAKNRRFGKAGHSFYGLHWSNASEHHTAFRDNLKKIYQVPDSIEFSIQALDPRKQSYLFKTAYLIHQMNGIVRSKLGPSSTGLKTVVAVPNTVLDGSLYSMLQTMLPVFSGLTDKDIRLVPDAVCAVNGAEGNELPSTTGDDYVIVVDIGGDISQISVVHRNNEGKEVVAGTALYGVGSENVEVEMVKAVTDKFKKTMHIDLSNDHLAVSRLYEAAEAAKKELCSHGTSKMSVPFITADASGPKHLDETITKQQLWQYTESTVKQVQEVLFPLLVTYSEKSSSNIYVLLVGGACRLPNIDILKGYSNALDKVKVISPPSPEEIVCIGASY